MTNRTRDPGPTLPPSPARKRRLRPGEQAGAYRVEQHLGRGGFGHVYRGANPRGEPVAIKVLHGELIGAPQVMARFEREVEVMRRLRHPAIARLIASGALEDGRPYFVMEYVDGESLKGRLHRAGPMSPASCLRLLEPICGALDVAHGQGVIHRDLKASNVVVADGREPPVVLLDFGIAKLLDPDEPVLTAPMLTIGTATCMAPEQIRGKPVDARTDVYALGTLAYYMLTGQPVFAGETKDRSLDSLHLNAPRPAPSARGVSPAYDPIIARAMALAPADRYPSAGAFCAAIRAAC